MAKLKQKSAQDIQDEIFQKMPVNKKIKLGSDFSVMCLELGLSEGTKIPQSYLNLWLNGNK